MDCGGFLIKGSRPPSALSTHRPRSSQGRPHGYHTIARTSYTDETLFGSAHPPKKDEVINDFKAPWDCPKPLTPGHTYESVRRYKAVLAAKKTKPKNHHPLLWCPSPDSSKYVRSSTKTNSSCDDSNKYHWNTRSHFRHLKHTPTFVDESLFGERLKEPSFDAPWNSEDKVKVYSSKANGKKDHLKYTKPYLWDPSDYSKPLTQNGAEIQIGGKSLSESTTNVKRPHTAIGMHRSEEKSSNVRPVWKP